MLLWHLIFLVKVIEVNKSDYLSNLSNHINLILIYIYFNTIYFKFYCLLSIPQRVLLTRYITYYLPVTSSFSYFFLNYASSQVTSLIVNYNQYCVQGLDFVFSDGSLITTGVIGSTSIIIDLETNRLCNISSFCGLVCDYMQFCMVDLATTQSTCYNTGNLLKMPLNFTSNFASAFNLAEHVVAGFYGDYATYWGFNCLSNLGAMLLNWILS